MNWECTHTHRPKVYIDWHCALQLVKKIFVRYVYYHFGKHWKSCRRYFGKDLERLQYQFDSIHLASIELLVAENVLALNFHSLRFCVCRKSGQKWRGRQSNYVAANKVGGQIAIVVVVANAQGLICRVQHNYRHSQQALLTRALLLSSMTSGCQRCKCTFAHCELWIVLASQWKPVRAHSGHDCTPYWLSPNIYGLLSIMFGRTTTTTVIAGDGHVRFPLIEQMRSRGQEETEQLLCTN